jgi:carboxypeptidase D
MQFCFCTGVAFLVFYASRQILRYSWKVIFWAVMIFFVLLTENIVSGSESEGAVIASAGPRLGDVIVVEVLISGRAELDELISGGYNISNVTGDTVTVYATEEELSRLEGAGYEYRKVEPVVEETDVTALSYRDYAMVTSELAGYAAAYPEILRLYTLGQSVQGRELWAVLITDNPDIEEDEPEFKYVATMHGDESLGTEMCMYFIDMVLSDYNDANERIVGLVDNTAIWIVPVMNPDGLELGSRYNANGYDLNRSFPIYPTDYTGDIFDGEPLGDLGRQPEVAHVMRWTAANSFVLAANFHTGALVVNYPYDDDGLGSVDSPTPDDLLFEEISRIYSMYNLPMWNSSIYEDGITNGAAWYVVQGSMQDWNYRYISCNEVTVELSTNWKPPAQQLPDYWDDNRESMVHFLEAVHIGVRGVITNSVSSEPVWAEVMVEDNSHPVFTDPNVGDYYRMLLPGVYNLTFSAVGYVSRMAEDATVIDGAVTRIDVELSSADISGDRIVNFEDYSTLAEHWGLSGCGDCGGAELTGDGNVGIDDLRGFVENWLIEL